MLYIHVHESCMLVAVRVPHSSAFIMYSTLNATMHVECIQLLNEFENTHGKNGTYKYASWLFTNWHV